MVRNNGQVKLRILMRWIFCRADGISLACAESTISNNTVTDATDGGIVVFGAPGSTVSGNTIQSINRNLLGGINMQVPTALCIVHLLIRFMNRVDWGPWYGDYNGVTVTGNTLIAKSAMIKIGVAIGPLSWGEYIFPSCETDNSSSKLCCRILQ